MVVRKLSVFLLVIAFHAVVLGVVYLATRSDDPDKPESPSNENVVQDTTSEEESPKDTPKDNKPAPAPPVEDKPKYDYVFHTVAKGDFLGKIATKYKVSSKDIMKVNNLKDPNKIFLGQKLKIPVKN